METEYKDTLLKSFYIDNFMTTMDEEGQLYKIYDEVSKALLQAGMPFQMWNLNSSNFNIAQDKILVILSMSLK